MVAPPSSCDSDRETQGGDPEPGRELGRQPLNPARSDEKHNFAPGQTGGEAGIELFRRLRSLDPELPILLITAWTSLETAVQLVKEGASDYLAKPWDDRKLVDNVRELLATRRRQLGPAPADPPARSRQGRQVRQATLNARGKQDAERKQNEKQEGNRVDPVRAVHRLPFAPVAVRSSAK